MSKRLINKVELVFFKDDANGEYGLAHKETYDDNYGNGFNAFWNGIGMFHDVFEHYFEYKHKYFMGDYAMNVGGEMAAMGHMWYYQETLCVHNRLPDKWGGYYTPSERMIQTTSSLVQEAIQSGYSSFGHTLECKVPRQSYKWIYDNDELNYQCKKAWEELQGWKYDTENDEDGKGFSEGYKRSVTFRKIADLHRWGYLQAQRMVPRERANRECLNDFIEYWDSFCQENPAEEMYNAFKGVTVRVYKEGDKVSWTATLESKDYEIKSIRLHERKQFSIYSDEHLKTDIYE